MSFIFNPMLRSSFQKQRRNIATAESAMSTVWREEKLDIQWVSKHPDSEDESIGVGVGWDGRTQPSEIKACTGLGNGESISR